MILMNLQLQTDNIMHKILLLTIVIMVCGCKNEPTPDEIFENRLTKERIKIERVGIGKELYDFYEGMNTKMEELSTDPALRLLVLRVPVINDEDTLKQCIAYEEKGSISVGNGKVWMFEGEEYEEVPVTYAKIISIEQLNKDYIKIE